MFIGLIIFPIRPHKGIVHKKRLSLESMGGGGQENMGRIPQGVKISQNTFLKI